MTALTDWLDAAKARADAATPGPWEAGPEGASEDDFGVFAPEVAHDIVAAEEEADASFIAAARTDLPKALDALRAVIAACDKADANPRGGLRWVHTAVVRQAITEALGVEP